MRGLIKHSINIHAHYPLLYKKYLDPQRNIFQNSPFRADVKLPFINVEEFIALNNKLNDIPFLNPVETQSIVAHLLSTNFICSLIVAHGFEKLTKWSMCSLLILL
jgi:hypothetical protein